MIFLTTFSIGILVAQMRSSSSCILAAVLIVAAFISAALFSGSVGFLALGLAILGFNVGIAGNLVAIFLAEPAEQQA